MILLMEGSGGLMISFLTLGVVQGRSLVNVSVELLRGRMPGSSPSADLTCWQSPKDNSYPR